MVTKHHGSHVLYHPILCRSNQQVQPFKQIHCVKVFQFTHHSTSYLLQILTNQYIINILFFDIRIATPIKRHTACHIPQFIEYLTFSNNTTRTRTYIKSFSLIIAIRHIHTD